MVFSSAQVVCVGRPMGGDLVREWLDHYLATASRRMPVAKLWLQQAEA